MSKDLETQTQEESKALFNLLVKEKTAKLLIAAAAEIGSLALFSRDSRSILYTIRRVWGAKMVDNMGLTLSTIFDHFRGENG